jgi:hypothetical protein
MMTVRTTTPASNIQSDMGDLSGLPYPRSENGRLVAISP